MLNKQTSIWDSAEPWLCVVDNQVFLYAVFIRPHIILSGKCFYLVHHGLFNASRSGLCWNSDWMANATCLCIGKMKHFWIFCLFFFRGRRILVHQLTWACTKPFFYLLRENLHSVFQKGMSFHSTHLWELLYVRKIIRLLM